MKRLASLTLFSIGFTGIVPGQQVDSAKPESPGCQIPAPVKVYSPGRDVTAPQLLPITMPVTDAKLCKKKPHGTEMVVVIVDEKGVPRNSYTIGRPDDDMESLASRIASVDRFQPGTYNGQPVPVARLLEIKIEGCTIDSTDEQGKTESKLVLRDQPVQALKSPPWPVESAYFVDSESHSHPIDANHELQRVGGKITAPVPIKTPEAEYSAQARDAKFEGIAIVGLVVDADGNPQKLHIVRPLGMGLDEKALQAVCNYRFKPAMRDGMTPVPVYVNVEVNFRLFRR